MERVLGIGGVFFKARDPKALAAWYREHLGVPVEEGQTYGSLASSAAGEQTVWSTFPADTTYFGCNCLARQAIVFPRKSVIFASMRG